MASDRNAFEAAMLEVIAKTGPQSRAELGRATGITRATAGTLVARLLDKGILQHSQMPGDVRQRPVGRPGELVSLNPDYKHVIGVDAGIGFVQALRMNLQGDVVAERRVETRAADRAPERLARLIADLVRDVADGARAFGGVSVAIPGIVTREGHVMRAPFLDWHDVPFLDLIAGDLAPFGALSLENDANALAMGQVIRGTVSPDDMNIFFSMDVGVGGSIVRGGVLMDGQSGLAGEFGHIFVHPSTGGAAVRLENVIGRRAVLDRYAELGGQARDLEAFLAALDAGETTARALQAEWIEVLAQALATITSVLNPGCIAFGGSLTALLDRSLPELDAAYQGLLMHGTVKPRFVLADSAQHSVALGCGDIRRAAVLRTCE
ncbi:MAG: ROK family transcriptional regulator [Pseudomonadota bacterium]